MDRWETFFFRRASLAAAVGLAASLSVAQAQEYRLQPGDVVDFGIVGNESLARRASVTSDGTVRVPLAGQFKAEGRTIGELRDEIVGSLRNASFPSGVDAQGSTVWNVIYPEGVLVDIAEYQPVYVSGDVLTPGSQVFRFGLTVRQAVAMAGGYSAFRSRQDPTLDLAGSEGAYLDALAQVAEAELETMRIRSDLAGAPEPDFSALTRTELDPQTVEGLKDLSRQRFQAGIDDRTKQRAAISEAITSAETRSMLLSQSQANLEAETRNYEAELRRVEELLRKGLTQVARLNDAQRAVFLVSTRSLETSAEVARLQRELVDLRRSLEKVETDNRIDNLAALQEATLALSKAKAELGRADERRGFQAAAGPGDADRPRVMLVRRSGADYTREEVGEDTVLVPGDVVEIALRRSAASGSAASGATTVSRQATAR